MKFGCHARGASAFVAIFVAFVSLMTLALPAQAVSSAPRGDRVTVRPRPPVLPRNFHGVGRYLVPSLHVNVPFSWNANHGNVQMVAGGPRYRIWFTNVIFNGSFYTHTYKWPTPIPDVPCTPIKGLNLAAFNNAFAHSHYVGPEILLGSPSRRVQHWRLSGALGPIPLTSSDIYVDQNNRTTWWQVLHFGLQNVYAPDLDEWIKMQTWSHQPGKVTLPKVCT